MSIKRRLFLSNMLMLVIPVTASILLSYAILFLFTRNSPEPMERAFPSAFAIISRFQRADDEETLLLEAEQFNLEFERESVLMVVANRDTILCPADSPEPLQGLASLLTTVMQDNISGTFTAGGTRIMTEQVNGYHIFLIDNRNRIGDVRGWRPGLQDMFWVFGILLVMVILTNRILTRSLTNSIVRPLNLLVDGVHQLGDGNLDYRIHYDKRDEFAQVCADFNEMAVHLQWLIDRRQKDDISRKELLAGISHDIRTPLTSIQAYVEGLLDGVAEDYPTQLKYLKIIRTKASDIDQFVDKLFLFSKLEIDEYPFHMERIDIGKETDTMLDGLREEYQQKGLDIRSINSLSGVFVRADLLQLRTAVSNVLENSLKYKTKVRGTLAVEYSGSGSDVSIILTDDGPGVPEESLEKLFEVFYREDASRQDPEKGSGLGLAITRKIIQRMGGAIWAENAEGGGLRVTVKLPVAGRNEDS